MTLNLPDGDAWAKCQDANDPTNWVILSFVEGSKTDMTSACGTGGLAEFVSTLQDDQIHYAAFVIYGVDERGNVTSRREKFVSVTWVGENVKVMAKSKVSGQRTAAMGYFSGAHIAYQIMDGDRDDISEAELQKKLLQVGGAHKPKYYDFGGASGVAAKAANSGDSGEGGLGMPIEKGAPAQGTGGGEAKDDGAAEAAEAAAAAAAEKQAAEAAAAADLEKERRVLEDKQKEADAAAEQEAAAAAAAAAKDAEQARLAEVKAAEDAAAAATEAAEREAAQASADAAADAEQAEQVEAGPPAEETLERVRKLSVDAAAASPVKAAAEEKAEAPAGGATYDERRKRWLVEKVDGGEPIYIKETKMNQTVYIVGCKNATIVVEGKVNSVAIDGCTKTQVVVDTVLSAVECVNCKQVKFQISGSCGSAAVDKTDGCTIYLMSDEAKKVSIVTSGHSDVQVAFMKGDEMVEVPVPEQFVHEINKENGKLLSDVSELYSS